MTSEDLIQRLKTGHGVDRELDAEIYCALHEGSKLALIRGNSNGFVRTSVKKELCSSGYYTESLDACRALQESVLPGWNTVFMSQDDVCNIDIVSPQADGYRRGGGDHSDWCRAWIIAILQAVGEKG